MLIWNTENKLPCSDQQIGWLRLCMRPASSACLYLLIWWCRLFRFLFMLPRQQRQQLCKALKKQGCICEDLEVSGSGLTLSFSVQNEIKSHNSSRIERMETLRENTSVREDHSWWRMVNKWEMITIGQSGLTVATWKFHKKINDEGMHLLEEHHSIQHGCCVLCNTL